MSKEAIARRVLTLLKQNAISKDAAYQLLKECGPVEQPPALDVRHGSSVAVIGLAARMPRADNADQFWRHLYEGVDLVRPLPVGRRADVHAHYEGAPDDLFLPGKRYWDAGYLEEVDKFDAAYFGIGPAEAATMDPSHRLFLQTAVEAMEDAGYAASLRHSRTGVFTGNPGFNYAETVLEEPSATVVTGNLPDFMASRLAFLYDFCGPVFGVQSTCASSLVAVHLACRSLRSGECDYAIAGGATIFSFPANVRTNPATASGIISPDERCRPFDQGGNGMGRGEGVVAFLLKPLALALADGDFIHAVIKGSSVNNDGRCAGLTAPNPRAHAAVLQAAWRDAGIDPRGLQYLEAHGTGTHLGDPIEIQGIRDAFAPFTGDKQFLPIGSVKGNIGHLVDGAAGASGLLKTILAMKNRTIPKSLHFDEPNAAIPFIDSPVFVADRTLPWESSGLRLAGVSSFGFNGTNCHVVVEEAPPAAPRAASDGRLEAFVLSAKTPQALDELVDRHLAALPERRDQELRDVCFTLAVGREHHGVRFGAAVRSYDELSLALSSHRKSNQVSAEPEPSEALSAVREYVAGRKVDLASLFAGRACRRVPLPTYPFQRERHWFKRTRRWVTPDASDRVAGILNVDEIRRHVHEVWAEVLGRSAGVHSTLR